jgi:hypothetical protein
VIESMTDPSRYSRQIAVREFGPRGQSALERAQVRIAGSDLAAEVCARYLAGAGVGTLSVDPVLVSSCRAINATIRVEALPSGGPLAVELAGARFSPDDDGSSVGRGARAARWAIARALMLGAET